MKGKRITIKFAKSLKTKFESFPERVKGDYKDFGDFVNQAVREGLEDLERESENNPCSGGWYKGHTVAEKDKDLVHPICTVCKKKLQRYKRGFYGDSYGYSIYNPKKKVKVCSDCKGSCKSKSSRFEDCPRCKGTGLEPDKKEKKIEA